MFSAIYWKSDATVGDHCSIKIYRVTIKGFSRIMQMNIEKCCRVCTSRNAEMVSIFEYYKFCEYYSQIFKVITKCASVQIQKLDGFSEQICMRCIEHLCQAFSFKQLCEDSDYKFRHNLLVDNKNAYGDEVTKIQYAEVNEGDIKEKLYISSRTETYPEKITKEAPGCSTDFEFYGIKSEFIEENSEIRTENEAKEDVDTSSTTSSIEHEVSSKTQGEKPYNYDVYDKTYSTSGHVRFHTRENPYKCDFCDKKFVENSTLAVHIREHTREEQYDCEFCDKKFSSISHLDDHIRLHTGEKPFKCEFCEQKFSSSTHLVEHIRLHTGEKTYDTTSTRHIMSRTGEKPYKCDFCEKKFAETSNLAAHIRLHTGEKRYKCDFCDKKFITNVLLADHVRSHIGDKLFKCDFCDKDFSHRGTLATHIRLHTVEKGYKCDFCERKFKQKSSLTAHIRLHTGETSYDCDICEKKFTSSSGLDEHIRKHIGTKGYKCDFCEKIFATSLTLTKHIRSKHTEEK